MKYSRVSGYWTHRIKTHGRFNLCNLKGAFASAVFLLEKNPSLLDFGTVQTLLGSMNYANTVAFAFTLTKCMFKNGYFISSLCGVVLLLRLLEGIVALVRSYAFLMRLVGLQLMRSWNL